MNGYELVVCILIAWFLISQKEPNLLFIFSGFCFLDGIADFCYPHRVGEAPYAIIFAAALATAGFLLSRKSKSPTIRG